jgi:2,4-dienoyl-CoA reductase-like NADH-dependent reductase (Old Yellow Enzyme family)
MSATDVLRRPLVLRSETLPNRLAKAAMTEGLADAAGRPTDGLVRLYDSWARGGAGLLVTGNVQVDRRHLERPGNVVLAGPPDQLTKAMLAAWANAARRNGAGVWMQLSHAGRQTPALVNPRPKAPSAVPLALPGKEFGAPVSLARDEILDLLQRFPNAAVYARDAGFTGVQIHAAHGYLISQFLSPHSNRRNDHWGGSIESRAHFLLEVVRRTREAVGRDFTLSVKLNSADFQRGGFSPGDSLLVAGWLAAEGVDMLEISGGTYEQPRMMGIDGIDRADASPRARSTIVREAYFLEFAAELRKSVTTPLMVTGGFRSAAAMAEAIEAEGVSIVGVGRPLCVDPLAIAKLFAGQSELERWERKLSLGSGVLGPASPLGLVKMLNALGAQAWYYQQLRRMGEGRSPDPKLGLVAALRAERAAQKAWIEKAS